MAKIISTFNTIAAMVIYVYWLKENVDQTTWLIGTKLDIGTTAECISILELPIDHSN